MATQNGGNPLLHDVVLKTIFQHFVTDVSNLKSFRLVCHSWKTGSLKQWRKAGVLVLLQEKKKKSSSKKSSENGHVSIEEVVSLMEDDGDNTGLQLGRRPYERIRLKEWRFYGDAFWQEHLFGDKLGGFVTYLHLDHCTFHRFSVLNALLTWKLPVLTTLVLSDCKFFDNSDQLVTHPVEELIKVLKRDHGQRQNFQRSLKTLEVTQDSDWNWKGGFSYSHMLTALLYTMPGLQELNLRVMQDINPGDPEDRHLASLFDAINNVQDLHINNADGADDGSIANHGNKFHIRKLDIMDYVTNATTGGFLSDWTDKENILDLRLEWLTIDVGMSTTKFEAEHIFSANPQTLKVLKGFRAPFFPDNQDVIFKTVPFTVEMTALEELYLWGNFTTNLEFLKYTPNLQTLVLKTDCYDKWYKLKSLLQIKEKWMVRYAGDIVEETLEQFRRPPCREFSPGQALSVGSLAHLDTDYYFSAESILTLAIWLPNVSTLKMNLTNETLEAVSRGWPKLTELELLFGSEVDEEWMTYLLRLSALKDFKSNAYCNEGQLSTSSVDRVFLKMKTLKSLEICVSSKMSVSAEMELRRNIAHVKVIRNYDADPYHHDHSHECCDRTKFSREKMFYEFGSFL